MFRSSDLLAFLFVAVAVSGQQIGTLTPEVHPQLQVSTCTAGGAFTAATKPIVIDSNWRFLHNVGGSTNCYSGNTWDTTLCPDPATCAANCALDGADYTGTYGITTSADALTLKFVTHGPFSTNIGSRVYLMDSDDLYQEFNLLNQEFTFTVDMSQLPCGLNGALYFTEMDADGGVARFPTNKAGARYGTGYCDAQCPHDLKFINGAANVVDWTPSPTDPNSGTGMFGTCCSEMDIWEGNTMGAAFTPHVCSVVGQTECSGIDCGDGADRQNGVCDKDGCDFNSFRMGNQTFFGPEKTIDTTQPITVVTQFITDDNTATGTLTQIKRIYVQNGEVIQNSNTNIPGLATTNAISDAFCTDQKTVTGDPNTFEKLGGLPVLGNAFKKGMVLVMSLWDDHAANMLWLDSNDPADANPATPGIARGLCSTTSGVPATIEAQSPNSQVIFSGIKTGPIGSTFTA
ncbi:cellobiohydrolaseI [Stereum hirsutum FP-91666 SS1]|uniref:cellobiohydrolaseI n=1 Tax=Stereum hirsutum (strain FP-91666) TaxID=721885 RepID=UPI0004449414|nr:cellobiohydrolaseI [Stereum hirsutum FP-91666 SS1]EIM83934.1 cellobiohydrolaseI [Stereum hirsutum FP-91666 SS1]